MYIPLHVHSSLSMLDGVSQPSDIAKRCKELGLPACALTDHGNICGAIKFVEAMKKQGLKPILGCELYICEHHSSIQTDQNKDLIHLVVLAKNHQGYKDLLKIISKSNTRECFYRKPRLSLPELKELNTGNLIGFSGHLGSHMANCMFSDMKTSIKLKKEKHIRGGLVKNVVEVMESMASTLLDVFGRPNFFFEIQLIDNENLPMNNVVAAGLRYLGKKMNIDCIATPDAHYCKKEDAINQRIILCNSIGMTMTDIYTKIKSGEDVPLLSFFNSSNYHIPSVSEMQICGHTNYELENTLKIGEMCEEYTITNPPSIPSFNKLNGLSKKEYLRSEIKKGFEKRRTKIDGVCLKKSIPLDFYRERYKREEGVILDASLEDYFFIVQDIINFAKKEGIMVGPGRGSAAGCLTSYLLGITDVDPIEYDLLFERFYNSSRKGSLPDIDMDFETGRREEIFEYLRREYGDKNFARICTFNKLSAKNALKEVLRSANVSFSVSNEITKTLIDESKIADKIQEIHDEEGDTSYNGLLWNIDHNTDTQKYCFRNENGDFCGDYSQYFEQANEIVNIVKAVSTHACGCVISNVPIEDVCPLIRAKNGELVCGFEHKDAEKTGLVKVDLLGLNTISLLKTTLLSIEQSEI